MNRRRIVRRQIGFGLTEILVGLAIGMIATLVIVQVATTFEGQKRSSTGTADAQTTGSVALYLIQRQVQMAGYGLPVFSQQHQVLNCAAEPTIDHDGNAATPEIGIAPVVIIDGGNGMSDTVAVRMGTTGLGGIPLKITGNVAATMLVASNMACPLPTVTPAPSAPDVALITDGTNCAMRTITALPTPTQITLDSVPPTALALDGSSSLACLGKWTEKRYTVNGTTLLENGVQIAGDIVSMQARYGIAPEGKSNQVAEDSYVDAKDDWGAAISTANRNRIKAIRIAIVVRNGVMEKDDVTQGCSEDAPNGPCAWVGTADNPAPVINLSGDANWKKYRYRVFDTVIPVRNIIWSADALAL